MIRDGKPPESSDNEPNKNPGFAENQTELESKKMYRNPVMLILVLKDSLRTKFKSL